MYRQIGRKYRSTFLPPGSSQGLGQAVLYDYLDLIQSSLHSHYESMRPIRASVMQLSQGFKLHIQICHLCFYSLTNVVALIGLCGQTKSGSGPVGDKCTNSNYNHLLSEEIVLHIFHSCFLLTAWVGLSTPAAAVLLVLLWMPRYSQDPKECPT